MTKKITPKKKTTPKIAKKRKTKSKFEKLHVLSWMITPAIIWGIYMFLSVIIEMKEIQAPFCSEKYYNILATIYPGVTPCITGAFIALIYGMLHGAIMGGLFAYTYNSVRKFFK